MHASQRSASYTAADSPLETARFGLQVRRYSLTGNSGAPLIEAIRTERPDLAIVRIPTARAELVTALAEVGGQLVLGDCRVIYTRDNEAAGRTAGSRIHGFRMRIADAADAPLLDALVDEIFAGYRTHYATNPRLAAIPVTEGYKEWTRAHIGAGERWCMVGEISGVPCAFTTVHVSRTAGEVVLNGVRPQYRGQGVYRDLLRATIDAFIDAGAPTTVIATQIDNRAVQRVWVSEGFRLASSEYTIHINFGG
ncbi:MAG: GNAT family N-acetyltransferase [Steroidobacteraceae bacterium]